MPDAKNISEIDQEADLILAEIEREADILVETIFAVPPGMERMASTDAAFRRLGQLNPEERQAYFQQNPDMVGAYLEWIARKNGRQGSVA